MEIARFGYEAFYVNSRNGIYTPSDLSFEYGKTIETQNSSGKKPVSYMGDVSLIKSGFKLHLDYRFVNVQQKIDTWRSMAEGSKLYAYSVGGKMVSTNKFVVTSVKTSNIKMNGQGVMLSADLDISIEEYAGKQTTTLNTKPLFAYE